MPDDAAHIYCAANATPILTIPDCPQCVVLRAELAARNAAMTMPDPLDLAALARDTELTTRLSSSWVRNVQTILTALQRVREAALRAPP